MTSEKKRLGPLFGQAEFKLQLVRARSSLKAELKTVCLNGLSVFLSLLCLLVAIGVPLCGYRPKLATIRS